MSFDEWNKTLDEVDSFSAWEQALTIPVLDTVESVDEESENTLRFADNLETPVPVIEDYYHEILNEDAFIADPKDVPSAQPSAQPKLGPIGLVEQIQRMDAIDWLKRPAFSVWGAVDTADIALTAKRLQKNQYETVGDLKKKVTEAQETGRFAEPLYEEEVRLSASLPEWDKALPGGSLSSSGEQIRLRDIQRIEKFLLEQYELAERGQTFAAKVFDGASYLPGWMIEFSLTGGLSKLGNETARQIATKTLRGYVKTKAGRAVLRASGWAGGAITRASLGLSHRVIEKTFEHRIPKQMHFGPNGNLIIDVEPDNWATSILKGWGDIVIEAASEEAGQVITEGLSTIVKRMPFGNQIIDKLGEAWTAIKPENTRALFVKKIFTRAGYSNIIGEVGEEFLATQLKAITDIDDFGLGENATMFERMAEGLTQDIKNLPVTAAVLALPAGVQYAAGRMAQNEQLPFTEIPDRQKGEVEQMQSDISGVEAIGASEQYLNEPERIDFIPQEPTEEQVGFIRDFFHKIGVKDKSGFEPLADKDFVDFFKFLQMPEDIRRTFPQFDPVYQVQRAREVEKANLDNTFAEITKPYFELSDKNRKKVDAVLFEADRNPAKAFGPKTLGKLGLDEIQQKAFFSIREGLDTSKNLLIDRMKDFGVKKETIAEFEATLQNYIPHKWYGNWAVVAREKFVEKEKAPSKKQVAKEARAFLAGEPIPEAEKVKKEIKHPRTIFMTATGFTDRFTERDRVKKLYPDADVILLKRKKIPFEAFQQAPPFAVQKMLDLAVEKAETTEEVAASMREALSDLFKSKGFGMHFIRRKNIPGYTEDLKRPLAEYFAGFSGYISKTEAVKAFPDAMREIHPQRTPNLYKYALDYIKYVTGDPLEFANAKRGMYFYYLFGNIKSASLNMTQNITLGWPILSRNTNYALPKLLQAMARTAVPKLLGQKEKSFIKDLEKAGYLQPQLSQEISGISGNPILQQVKSKTGKLLSMADVFRLMESFNRRSMAVALYDAGIRDIKQAGEFIDEAHFHYSKGNRPALARGYISPIMVFRSWNINYMLWLKNQIKEKEVGAFARSVSALLFFGGVAALPGWEALKFAWRKIFGTDPEAEARDTMGRYWGQIVMKGAPTALGVSFTGSVGMADIIPTDLKSMGGVFADIPDRVGKVSRDIKSKQYGRALEDASPEFLRNPLSAYRLYKDGALSRSGRTILDLETGKPLKISGLDATKKALGFQPSKLAEQWDLSETLDFFTTERLQKKQNWADRYWLGFLNKDLDAMEEVVGEMVRYNKKQISRGRQPISMDEMDSMLQIRSQPINIPPNFMLPALQEIKGKFFKE